MSFFIVLFSILGLSQTAQSQAPAILIVEVVHDSAPVAGATVVAGGVPAAITDSRGLATIPVPPGQVRVAVSKDGFAPVSTTVEVAAGADRRIVVELHGLHVEEEITVSATRTEGRIEDQPLRVEVLNREEIEEKLLMTPGDIVMMLNEMGGMRVQATSPSLGAASVRIQGMKGRYTTFLSDGLPLFGEVGGLGLLQIPPMDLRQVEVIKGVASSMYGAGAMGGVVNLLSRRPGNETERELMLNRSTRGGTDAIGWFSTPARTGWAMTLLAGGHFQERTDVDGDAWADLPRYSRAVVRPRVFWDGGDGRSLFATAGFTGEDRSGGGQPVGGTPFRESLTTRRFDVGAVGQTLVSSRHVVTARGAYMQQRHGHQFGEVGERDRHEAIFGEVTVRTSAGRHLLVAGLAVERDAYRARDLPQFSYTFTAPGVFVQDDVALADWLSLSASARFDHHSEYGSFLSPRIAALVRAGSWSSRVSAGTGFYGPSPLTEETEAAGLSRLTIPDTLEAERGRNLSLDVSRTAGPGTYTVTLFRSRVTHPLTVDRANGLVLTNATEPAISTGVELLMTLRQAPWGLTGSYTYIDSTEVDDGRRQQTPLTPRHSAGVVGMWEREGEGRVGIELYYTGRQRLEHNPFLNQSRHYLIVGLLVEKRVSRFRVFVNGENLTGVRQTRWSPLVRPARGGDGRWTVDAWAPLEGRSINGGFRFAF